MQISLGPKYGKYDTASACSDSRGKLCAAEATLIRSEPHRHCRNTGSRMCEHCTLQLVLAYWNSRTLLFIVIVHACVCSLSACTPQCASSSACRCTPLCLCCTEGKKKNKLRLSYCRTTRQQLTRSHKIKLWRQKYTQSFACISVRDKTIMCCLL